MNRALLILLSAASSAVAEPREVIVTYRDGVPAADIEIQLQYPSAPTAFRTRTDKNGKATFDRNNFAQLHVIYSRGDERVHFHVDRDRLQWPFLATLPASSDPSAAKQPFALTNAQNQPLSVQSFRYFVGQFGAETPASSVAQILSSAPAQYQSLDILAESRRVFVRLSKASLDTGGTLTLGVTKLRSQ